ncbi:hydrogenase maturation nickel metallochaperone HypA [Candidatus Bipolaricaulota bacterium]
MHEYSVAAELVDALLAETAAIEGQIVGVILKKGELRILSDQSLGHAFELLSEGTALEGARLIIESVPVNVACAPCGYQGVAEYVTDEAAHFTVPILSCPKCQSKVDVLTGRELFVDRLTVRAPTDTESA